MESVPKNRFFPDVPTVRVVHHLVHTRKATASTTHLERASQAAHLRARAHLSANRLMQQIFSSSGSRSSNGISRATRFRCGLFISSRSPTDAHRQQHRGQTAWTVSDPVIRSDRRTNCTPQPTVMEPGTVAATDDNQERTPAGGRSAPLPVGDSPVMPCERQLSFPPVWSLLLDIHLSSGLEPLPDSFSAQTAGLAC